MKARDFKKMAMCLNTKKGNQIKLLHMYCEYTSHYHERQLREKDRESVMHWYVITEMASSFNQTSLFHEFKREI